ncbi:MAG: hypothetical protein E7430_05715 [Ruminococcaceae bacterium]|nr:hypothetical protein [Oscillospiraceae bacterium]
MNAKRKAFAALVLNILLLVLEIKGSVMSVQETGWGILLYFTDYSNNLSLIASAFMVIYLTCYLKKGIGIPMWLKLMKYMAACSLTITLMVVVFILAPSIGRGGLKWSMLYGDMLYHHFLCPVLAIVLFVFFEHEPRLEKKHTFYGLIPVSIYAAVFIVLNLLRIVEGPYPFLKYYQQPIYMSIFYTIVIPGGAYLIALGLRKLNTVLE